MAIIEKPDSHLTAVKWRFPSVHPEGRKYVLIAAFATLLYLGPDVAHPSWRFITPGSIFAAIVWLAASGAFAVYTAMFGSYNKTWGSLAAVIIMLTWLWLAAIALLLGAEINAETERSRELRQGQPAERELLAPTRSSSR